MRSLSISLSRLQGRLLLTGLAIAGLSLNAYALDPGRAVSQYVRQQWGPDQGFPGGPVYAITQTQDGYLWIGADAGLVRFDGLTFRPMQNSGEAGIPLAQVFGLTTDVDGSLWMRLRGLNMLHYSGGAFRRVMADLPEEPLVTAMARSQDGGLLLATRSRGVVRLRGGNLETLVEGASLPRSPILSVAEAQNGDVWLGTRESGLIRWRGHEVSVITKGLPDLKVNCLAAGGGGELWIGTDKGMARWNGREIVNPAMPDRSGQVAVLALTRDRDSNIWAGTESSGLLRINSRGVVSLNEREGVSHEAINAVFEDREGNLWIGGSAGIERFRDSPFVSYSVPEGLPSDGNNPVFVDAENRMWFPPVDGGLWWVKDGRHGRVTEAGLDKDVVYSIGGRNGELWLGRQRGGLTRLLPAGSGFTAKSYTHADGLAQNSVFSVYETRDGTVWAGTLSAGVSKLSRGRFTTYTTAEGLASNTVAAILEAADGSMWLATPAGLSALSKGHWRTWTAKDGLPSDDVNCLLEDSGGVLWAGTAAGLAFRDSGGFRIPEGVPASLNERILGLAEDRQGSLWIATSGHVLRVNRDKLLRGTLAEGDVREFGYMDGLRGLEGVKRSQSVIADSLGQIWFSLNRGISSVDPARLRNSSAPVTARVQTISADNSAIDLPAGSPNPVHIPGGRKRIAFGFTGLNLSLPERVRFRYQLEGFDGGWSEPVSTREAIYTNLAPGAYRFRLMASNPDGVWNGDETAVSLEVDPLFWQTWWFRLLMLLALAAATAAVYKMRLHQLTKRLSIAFDERLAERTRIAQELHDTLLQGFISASMQVHVANDRLPDDSQIKPILTRAVQLMGQVIEEGRHAVRGLRSAHSSSLDLEQALSLVQDEMAPAERAGSPIDFRVIVDGERRPLHPVLRDEVYRIGREALTNAFRHAQAKSIDVELTYSSRALRLLVRDDGRGIDPQVLHAGRDGHWGLPGMRERADRIGARLQVFSSSTAGTEIELSVPSHLAFEDQRRQTPKSKWFGGKDNNGKKP